MALPKLVLLAAIVLVGCACAEPQVASRPPPSGNPAVSIYVVAHERHTGLVLPRADIPAGLWPESRDFPQADYLEVGRRVYSGAVVVLACVKALTAARVAELNALLGVDRRTLRRWRRWWREAFVHGPWWQITKARFSPPLDQSQLPGTLLERFAGAPESPLVAALRFLSPLTAPSA